MRMMYSPPTESPFLDKNPSGNDTDTPSSEFSTPADDATMTDVSQTPPSLMPITDTTSSPPPILHGNAGPPRLSSLHAHAIGNWADHVDEEEAEDDATIISEPEIPAKEYSFHVTFGLKKKQRVDPFSLFHNLALEMMHLDSSFKIHAYDRQTSDLWPLASPDDIPTAEDLAQQYFVRSQINKQNTQVTVIFCVTSRYSHIEW
jgi:hypothetical protein